jgi:alkaline phosphatase D
MSPQDFSKSIQKLCFCLCFLLSMPSIGQIKSGPMLGYSEMKEVLIWVQTEKASKVEIKYWDKSTDGKQKFISEPVQTNKANAYIARIIADEVSMSKRYTYEVYVDGKKVNFNYPLEFQTQTLYQYRTEPPSFSFVFGSCNYINEEATDRPGRPYGGADEIYQSILNVKPDFLLWGGDNFYYREADWNTRTGMIHRNDHTRGVKSIQPLLASTHNYAIWDDHDYGPNDSDRSWVNKHTALEMFKLYWGNPNYTFPNEGITGQFQWADVEFFLMDDRWFKAPNDLKDPTKDYWGQKQMNWLLDALTTSKAPFKIVVNGGQILNPAKIFENMSNYEAERNQLLAEVQKRNIAGVVFLSGDRHVSSLWKMERPGTYPLFDLTVTPFTAGPAVAHPLDKNPLLVPGTLTEKRAFSKLSISGPAKERVLTINVYDHLGKDLWNYTIKANDLK